MSNPTQRFVISHLKDSAFKTGGLRHYSAYRDLGVAEATNGLAHAHVIRMTAPFSNEATRWSAGPTTANCSRSSCPPNTRR